MIFKIKTSCGKTKYNNLKNKKGFFSKVRLVWFVIIAVIRDIKK